MHYRQIWEKGNGKTIPDNYEIHHIDGNRANDMLENLKLVSIEEHLEIHRMQGDIGAVQAILMRMDCSHEDLAIAASNTQKRLLKEGRHNVQKIDKLRRSEISKTVHANRRKLNKPAFLNIQDVIGNSQRGGQEAARKKAGFLNTGSENHGSRYVKGTFWWTNSDGKRARSKTSPGPSWKKGMKNSNEC